MFKRKQHIKSNILSSEHIQNEVLAIFYEHIYPEDKFERKFQAKISPSDQSFEKQDEWVIELNGKQKMEPNKF